MHPTQRLFGASQMLLPVGLVVQFAVPHGVEQVLFVPQVAPAGHCALSVHWTHWDAGSIVIVEIRRSQTLFVVSSAQSPSFKHSTQRLLGKSQMLLPVGFAVHPLLTVPQGVRPSATPASLVPALPADPPDPAVPPAPPVAVPPLPVEPAVPVDAPPVPAPPVVVEGGASSPPQAT
jgi:hypothetical protein